MPDFAFFLGRFHVLALHLPVGIVVAAVVLDWLARRERHAALAPAAPFLWGAAAVSAVLTVVLGYLHFAEGGFVGPAASAHRLYGTATAVAAVAAWWLAARGTRGTGLARLAAGLLVLGLVSVTGHYGGQLTHGTAYLTEYAPRFLGGGERNARPASVAAADLYRDVVQPILEQRCGTCHNDQKLNGGFSVATYDSTLVGGDTGRAVVPGNLQGSELFYRITLPPEDQAFMPAEGKTPPTAAQIEILRWWIETGAPRDTTVGALGAGAGLEALVAEELELAAPSTEARGTAAASADPALVQRLVDAGLLVRAVSLDDPQLVIGLGSAGTVLSPEGFAALAEAAPFIVDLNLAGADVGDDELASLGPLPAVTHLRLARNRLSDGALAALAALPRLEHLNLYGNSSVTDEGLEKLAAAPSLRELYLWQTAVTHEGAARLREQRPALVVDLGGAAPAPAPNER